MSAVARQSRVQATLACTTTVYPYSSPVSPDVDICCIAGWRLMFKIMRTRCLLSGQHTSTDNIVLGVLPTKNIGPISIRPNTSNIAQYPISQYQYRSNPTRLCSEVIVLIWSYPIYLINQQPYAQCIVLPALSRLVRILAGQLSVGCPLCLRKSGHTRYPSFRHNCGSFSLNKWQYHNYIAMLRNTNCDF